MLLRIDDLPAGFRAGQVPQPDRATEEAATKVRTCNPHLRPDEPHVPRAASPRFIDPTGRNIESFVDVNRSEAEAHEDVAAAHDASLMRCVVRVVYRPLSTEEPVLRRIPVESLGDEATGWRLILVPKDTGRRLYMDQITVRVGDLEALLVFRADNDPFTTAEERHLARLVVRRAPAG